MTGLFTCLYLAHIDSLGHAGKPFLLPQKSNDSYFFQYKSYNVPEFMKGMVRTNRKELEMAIGR